MNVSFAGIVNPDLNEEQLEIIKANRNSNFFHFLILYLSQRCFILKLTKDYIILTYRSCDGMDTGHLTYFLTYLGYKVYHI